MSCGAPCDGGAAHDRKAAVMTQETVRCARYCPTKDCTWREFSDPAAKCPEHGKGETEENRPYLGKPVAQHPTFKGSKKA